MNVVIDIGNTLIKVGLFEDSVLIDTFILENEKALQQFLLNENNSKVIISSVRSTENYPNNIDFLVLDSQTAIPIQNEYSTPATLGLDRIAGVIGGKFLFPNKDILVIDLGTCITFDFLKKNTYLGGSISPGLNIKLKALNTFTEKLPLVEIEDEVALVGNSTKNSILSGVINGTASEINATIEEYKRISGNLAVILCGGDAERIGKLVKHDIFIEKNLVLIGLNEILKHNS